MANDSSKNVFDFFSLPIELRDQVLDCLPTASTSARVTRKWSAGLRARVQHMPLLRFLLVSKGFSLEYRSVLAEKTILVVEDRLNTNGQRIELDLSSVTQKAVNLEVSLYIDRLRNVCKPVSNSCCGPWQEACQNFAWIPELIEALPRLQSTTVRVHVAITLASSKTLNKAAYEVHLKRFSHWSKVTRILVVINESIRGILACNWNYEDSGRWTFATWKASPGNLWEVEQIEP
jgi:hypothetical protein